MRPKHGLPKGIGLYSLVGAFLFFLSPLLLAQIDTGTILGTVSDQTGGLIPDAKVTLTNEGTGITLSSATRGDGTYIFTPIKIGTYTVEVEYPGFQKSRQTGIALSQQQQAVVDFTLLAGSVTETVEVTSQAPLLQTESGTVGEVVGSRAAVNLPLNGRNYVFLAQLTAGVTTGQQEGRGLNQNGWFSANGTRPAQSNIMLDGIDNNSNNVDFLNGAAYVVRPSVDAIAEFKISTNSYSAEFGRSGGAVLNASIKSGTNEIHGSVWDFIRNDKMDAANFFQNKANQDKGKFRRNQFGVAAGGPLVKNKTFWFADWEGTRIRQDTPWVRTVPTAAQRASGFTDWSDLLALQSGSNTDLLGRIFPRGTIFDPATTRAVTGNVVDPITGLTPAADGFVRDEFVGNLIPVGRINPDVVALLNLLPEPGQPGLFDNFTRSPIRTERVDTFDVRIDHSLGDSDQFFMRYTFFQQTQFKPGPYEGLADGGGFNDGDEKVRAQSPAVSWTHTFSPTLINEARLGYNRQHVLRLQPNGNDTSDIPGQFGIPGIPQLEGNGGLPEFRDIGHLSQFGTNTWLASERFGNTWQFTENLTKVYGSHTFKGGFEYQHIQFFDLEPPWSRGRFDFSGNFTSVPNNVDETAGVAQFLLTPTASTVVGGIDFVGGANTVWASNFGELEDARDYYAVYFQDDWKVSPKLALNLGLRWEFFGRVGEVFGAQSNFDPGGQRYLIPANRQNDPPVLSPQVLDAFVADGIALTFTDEFGLGLGTSPKTNFGPRFGFAYQVTERLVARGGYGISYGGFENRGGFPNLGYNYPFLFTFGFFAPNDATPIRPNNSIGAISNGFLGVPLDPAFVTETTGLNLRGIEFGYDVPYVQSYNLTVQYELSPNDSFEVGYVGSLGRHIETFSGSNHPTQILPPDVDPQPLLPFPSFQRGSTYATRNANSYYHSLQVKITRRTSRGLNFLTSYTWAKTRTNANDLLNGGGQAGFRAPDIPGVGIQADYQLANFHIPHAFNFSGTYELPLGTGKQFLANSGGIANAVVGGWSLNWINTLYSGNPVNIGCQTKTTASGIGCHALLTGQDINAGPHDVDQFWNPAAFMDPPVATVIGQTDFAPLGGAPTQARGPGFHRFDLSVFKRVETSERTSLEFRAEFFNLTNTPNFALPSNRNFKSDNFGVITSSRDPRTDSRQIQFALKFHF